MRRFFTLGWLGLHATAIVLVTAFLGFGWWQLQRAEGGNMRSWGYTFEWPLFAVFVIVMWVKMMYDELHDDRSGGPDDDPAVQPSPAAQITAYDTQGGEDDPELAAYNRYLARLAAESRRRG